MTKARVHRCWILVATLVVLHLTDHLPVTGALPFGSLVQAVDLTSADESPTELMTVLNDQKCLGDRILLLWITKLQKIQSALHENTALSCKVLLDQATGILQHHRLFTLLHSQLDDKSYHQAVNPIQKFINTPYDQFSSCENILNNFLKASKPIIDALSREYSNEKNRSVCTETRRGRRVNGAAHATPRSNQHREITTVP